MFIIKKVLNLLLLALIVAALAALALTDNATATAADDFNTNQHPGSAVIFMTH